MQGTQRSNLSRNTSVARTVAPVTVKIGKSDLLEPRPLVEVKRISDLKSSSKFADPSKDSYFDDPSRSQEDDYITPLRSTSPQRNLINNEPCNKIRKEDLDASGSSLMVDCIFNREKSRSKLNGSATSIMSLGSVNTISDLTDPDSLGPLFDSSLKLGHQSSTTSMLSATKPSKSSFRRSTSNEESMNQERGMASVLEMSVNTIDGDLSDGDSYYAKMTASQANMSFASIFDEAERDFYVTDGGEALVMER